MKKILSFAIAICLFVTLAAIPITARFADVAEYAHYRSSVERLANFGIIGGMGDGNFNPYGELTRAQFARIATTVAGFENEVIGNASVRRFSDVDVSHWANGHINTVARHGIITGYPDGTYLPEQSVNFAEAVTIVLRLLGWNYEDLGHNWPMAYINKARELRLIDGIYQDAFAAINRANIAIIIDRALNTEMNIRVHPGEPLLITQLNLRVTDETVIFATRAQDAILMQDEIRTTIGNFRLAEGLNIIYVPLLADVELVLNNDNRVVEIRTIRTFNTRNAVVDRVFGDWLYYDYSNGQRGQIRIDDNSVTIYRGNRHVFSQLVSVMESGSEFTFHYNNLGAVEFIEFREFDLQGPVVVREDAIANNATQIAGLHFDNNVRVIRGGLNAQLSDIRRYDVVYYAPATNTLHVYTDKVSGVYERAYPTKAAVNSIVLSGVRLEIETGMAANRLGENPGSFAIGATFTALLGRTGGIVDVVNMNAGDLGAFAIILSTESRISTDTDTFGRQEWFTTVMTGFGNIMELRSDRDYENSRGQVMRVSFDGDVASFSSINRNRVSGTVDRANRTIGGRSIAHGAVIIETTENRSGFVTQDATARVIDFSDIPQGELNEANVLHAEIDGRFGDITLLIVQNVTMSQYTFGFMTHSNIGTGGIHPQTGANIIAASGTYTIFVEGIEREFTSQNIAFHVPRGPVAVRFAPNGTIDALRSLHRIITSGNFETIDFSRIRIGGENFTLARDVQIYRINADNSVTRVALADFEGTNNVSNVQIFSDTWTAGGLVRVITFR